MMEDGTGSSNNGTVMRGTLTLQGAPPWTYLAKEATHPNGTNNGDEHHTIRRWTRSSGEEIDTVTSVALIWHLRKGNANGNGVTGSVHHNGMLIDSLAIAGVIQKE